MRRKVVRWLYRAYPGAGFAAIWFLIPMMAFHLLGWFDGWDGVAAIVLGGTVAMLVHRGPAFNLDGSVPSQYQERGVVDDRDG